MGSFVEVPREEITAVAGASGADHRANVYVEERDADDGGVRDEITGLTGVVVYRASSLGYSCVRSLVASRLGMDEEPPPDWMLTRYDEGTWSEDKILHRVFHQHELEAELGGKWKLLDPADAASYKRTLSTEEQFPHVLRVPDSTGQFTYEIPVGRGIVIRGHLDGIAELWSQSSRDEIRLGYRANVEAKCLGEDMYDDFMRKGIAFSTGYSWQVSLGMHAMGGAPTLFVVGQKLIEGKGEDRKFGGVGDLRGVVIEEMPVGIGKIKAVVAKVERLAREGLPACDRSAFPCPHFYLHDEESGNRKAGDADKVTVEAGDAEGEIVDAIAAYQAGAVAESKGKKAKGEAKERLEKLVEGLGVGDGGVVELAVGTLEWKVEEVAAAVVERRAYTKRYPSWKAKEGK